MWRRWGLRRPGDGRPTGLEALSLAGRALVAAPVDVNALCELIVEQAGRIIDTTTFQVGLFEDNLYHILIWTIDGERQEPRTFDLSENRGLVGWVQDHKQPLLVRDFRKEQERLPARPSYISSTPPRSAVFIPMVAGEECIGLLAAQSGKPNRFSHDDARRLTILANQAAAAIMNGRLYNLERNRAAQLELVGRIARRVNAIQDVEELFEQVVQLTRQTFGFHPVGILTIDPGTGEAVLQASSNEEVIPGTVRLAREEGLIGAAVASRQTTVSNNTAGDDRFIAALDLPEGDPAMLTRSEMVVPLIVDDELLGVLDVQSPAEAAFGAPEAMVLEALADQVAIAIHKARQFAAQREQAWATTVQLQVAEAVSRSPDLKELGDVVCRLVPLLVGPSPCAIMLFDAEEGVYRGEALAGVPAEMVNDFKELEFAEEDWHALDTVHVGLERLRTENCPPSLRPSFGQDHVSLYPLVAKGRPLGVMLVGEQEQHGWPGPVGETAVAEPSAERKDELLRGIANQAAQAIENAQLHIAQQEEAWVNTALLQVAQAVNSLLNLNEILDTIVHLVTMLVGVDSCLVLFWDEAKNAFRAGPSHGLSEMGEGLLHSFEIEESAFRILATETEQPLLPEQTFYEVRLPEWMATVLESHTAHAFPLNARGKLVGALVVGPTTNDRPLTGRRVNILTGIAQQAAVAVVNDHLYKESAERSRLENELRVAQGIQASLIPSGNPRISGCSVAGHWQAARLVSGDFYDYLQLPRGYWGIVVADVADKGVPAALFMTLSRTILRTVAFNRTNPAETLARVNQILFNDTQSDLFVTVFYAVWQPDRQTLSYANAGHNPPLLIHGDGRCTLLKGQGIALGVLEEITIEEKRVRLAADDTVVFYTDGVTEAMNANYDEFGLERLQVTATAARPQSAEEIVGAITAAIRDHVGETQQSDDITLVVMKREG